MEEKTRFHRDDRYMVREKTPHRPLTIEVLSQLYQPLMSTTALSLYLLLWSEAQQTTSTTTTLHRDLMAMLNVSAAHLERAFQYLEGIGLLRTYVKEDNHQPFYLYQLQAPLTAQNFFADEVLTFLLVDTIGEVRVQKLKEYFNLQPSLPENMEEVTAPFQAMYTFSEWHFSSQPSLSETPEEEKNVRYSSDEWRWFQHFLTYVDEHWVDIASLKQHKELIMTAHRLYQFDDMLLNEMITASVHPQTGILDAGKFQSLILRSGRAQKMEPKMAPVEKEEPQNHATQLFKVAQTMPPGEFLKSVKQQMNGIVTNDEQFTIKNIVEARVLDSGSLNLITYYCLWVKKDLELKRNRYEKIVNRIAQKQFSSLEEVWQAIPVVYQEVTQFKPAPYRQEKKVIRPEWEQTKQSQKEQTKQTTSEEMQAQLQAQLQQIRQKGGE